MLQATIHADSGAVIAQFCETTLLRLNEMRRTWLKKHFGNSQIRSRLIEGKPGVREAMLITHGNGRTEHLLINVQKVNSEDAARGHIFDAKERPQAELDLFGRDAV